MQLLLFVDSPEILASLPAMDQENHMLFDGIHIDVSLLQDQLESDQIIQSAVEGKRYHLVLALFEAKSWSPFESSHSISYINLVNNYRYNSEGELEFVVNKTTSYFNVFLEIPKGVSLSLSQESVNMETSEPKIKRIDSMALFNYKIAHYCQSQRANYYILNYSPSSVKGNIAIELQELLIKIG